MNKDKEFPLSLDFQGTHYEGTITPSLEKGANGTPVYFRITFGDELFAYLCCGDNGWKEREGAGKPNWLINAIGNYIADHYE